MRENASPIRLGYLTGCVASVSSNPQKTDISKRYVVLVYMSRANVNEELVNYFIYIRIFLHAYNIDSWLDLAQKTYYAKRRLYLATCITVHVLDRF